ncbi:phage-related baseplate assembly protein [Brevibacillus aydinogluensis]|uniref:baseplate assembly protein n=1 Tax=Brevibacillus aydinogluensis TaxID=927786 RepID=UPI00289317C8|nr:baseplate J/gp47 family protein [Brevibacillus aydinogluensis]MDT3416181.1 phage-related baseplate assembly protein [Brevibacillus aydinogluensis]
MTRFNLPDVTFADKSAEKIEADIVTRFEQLSDIKLAPADPRRKFIQAIVSLLAQQRSLIDYSAKMNMLAYSVDDFLDHLGVFTDTERLKAVPAITTVRFHFSVTQQQTIPAGTRVTAGDGLFFEIKQTVVVQAGQTQVDVQAECMEAGVKGNGYLPGQINRLVDPLPWVQYVENITTSEGGADEESNDAYAERMRQAPESFSVAGPEGAYIYWARTANSLIVDVSVRSPSPGVVEIRPLLQNGQIPGQEILDQVLVACSDRKVRPLTDFVQVLAPETISYDITLTYWISTSDSSVATSIQARVQKAIEEYKLWQKTKLGRDIDPSELITRVKNAGAKRVAVASPVYQAVDAHQVAVENLVTVTYGGLEDG